MNHLKLITYLNVGAPPEGRLLGQAYFPALAPSYPIITYTLEKVNPLKSLGVLLDFGGVPAST